MKLYSDCINLRDEYLESTDSLATVKCSILSRIVAIIFYDKDNFSTDELTLEKAHSLNCEGLPYDYKTLENCLRDVLVDMGYPNNFIWQERFYACNNLFFRVYN